MAKKELQVAAIENGTVIDHIPADKTYRVVRLLRLEKLDTPVTIGYNLPSSKMGKKGIIKIANKYFTDEEINRLSVVAPNIVLNTIHNFEVVEKKRVETPSERTESSSATTLSASPTTSRWRPTSPSTRSKALYDATTVTKSNDSMR